MTTTLKHAGDEEYLEQAANAVLPGEEVLAAGIFGLQDAIYGMMAGGAVGERRRRRSCATSGPSATWPRWPSTWRGSTRARSW